MMEMIISCILTLKRLIVEQSHRGHFTTFNVKKCIFSIMLTNLSNIFNTQQLQVSKGI